MIEERENTVELFLCVFPANKGDLGADHTPCERNEQKTIKGLEINFGTLLIYFMRPQTLKFRVSPLSPHHRGLEMMGKFSRSLVIIAQGP